MVSHALFCSRCWRSTGRSLDELELAAALRCYATIAALLTEVFGPHAELGVGDENPSYVCVWFRSGFFRRRELAFCIFRIDLEDERRLFSSGWEDVEIVPDDPRFIREAMSFSQVLSQKTGFNVTVRMRSETGPS